MQFCFIANGDVLTLPITPASYEWTTGKNMETINISELGDVYCTIALREYVDLEAQEVATLNTTRYTGNSGRKSDAAKDITYHRVVSGDTLSMLCRRTYGDGTASYYNALAKYNGISNPHLIYVGQTIKLPTRDILLGGG